MNGFRLDPATARSALGGHADTSAADSAVVDRYATVVWSHLVEPGDSVAGRIVASHGPLRGLEIVLAADSTASVTARELDEGRKRWMPRLDPLQIARSLASAARASVAIITRADSDWPGQLDDLGMHAPHCLWVRGDRGLLAQLRPSVAIVGARAATSYGDHVALELSADLAGGGIPVISGGAYGIDGAAHRAALGVGGRTVALLAGGVDRSYPAGHSGLIEGIAATGAVVSEVPCGAAPTKWRFLQRNRLIAALSDATIVVEAGWRSGSLNTAGHAASLSRRLGAVPGPVTSAASAGTHRLLREFDAACITSAADVRELLGLDTIAATSTGDRAAHTDDTTRVRDALSTRAPREATDLARRTGMSVDHVEAVLGLLQLEGAAVRDTTGWRSPTSRR
ncbi:DNA-processing protein DprA [Microbacterium sp. SSM24]|uniref:DNA-processing protein DprA n=1 Tax=Microbacterium sp. SSM24 TaxID=2991714 RepID=UPI002226E8AA|nr:DNA-processing protein DprA [Microbacterium sp. SSM24]MCW3494293.1 DNA-processing protein DprA [Microbacterium sp. SSM24]